MRCRLKRPTPKPSTPSPTLSEWAAAYPSLRPDLSPTTLSNYAGTLALLVEFVGGDTRLADVTKRIADDWRIWLTKPTNGERRSTYTIHSHIARARAAFTVAKNRGDVTANPFDGVTVRRGDIERDWAEVTRDDLNRLLAVCDPPWARAFALCRLAGLRRGEVFRLTWDDVDLAGGTLTVRCEESTTKRRARVVPIEPDLAAVLSVGGGTGLVCPVNMTRLHAHAVALIVKAGLEKYEKPFHTLRKNAESEWMSRYPVMSVCQWLGHSPAVAMKHYVRTSRETMSLVTGIKTQ